jgi:3-hydroxy-9,10-secoandrosta-1,3,5(10)-triene-9,17-dione monooxygenase reductase component
VPASQDHIDTLQFRHACGAFATGVAIVTRSRGAGNQLGLTVNSFSSISLEPPLILIAVQRTSSFLRGLRRNSVFAMNVLSSSHRHLSSLFAQRDVNRFGAMNVWCISARGTPILPDAAAIFQCRLRRRLICGDHVVLIGEVVELTYNDAEPLVFHRGQYCQIAGDSHNVT